MEVNGQFHAPQAVGILWENRIFFADTGKRTATCGVVQAVT
jgi:hypothetical protein